MNKASDKIKYLIFFFSRDLFNFIQMSNNDLTNQFWNIFGIFTNINGFKYNKLEHPDFLSHVLKHKIFGLVETQHVDSDIDKLQIVGYKCFQVCRQKRRAGRKHGGISVYVHNTILNVVSKVPPRALNQLYLN